MKRIQIRFISLISEKKFEAIWAHPKPRFKIDVVIMIICSIVIIINSVLTLQVSTAKPDDCGPCEIKVAFIHT